MERSDKFTVQVNKNNGIIDYKPENKEDYTNVNMPYAMKLLLQELQTMSLAPRLIVNDNIDENKEIKEHLYNVFTNNDYVDEIDNCNANLQEQENDKQEDDKQEDEEEKQEEQEEKVTKKQKQKDEEDEEEMSDDEEQEQKDEEDEEEMSDDEEQEQNIQLLQTDDIPEIEEVKDKETLDYDESYKNGYDDGYNGKSFEVKNNDENAYNDGYIDGQNEKNEDDY